MKQKEAIFKVIGSSLAVARDALKEADNFIKEIQNKINNTPNDQELGKEIRDFFNQKYKSDE